MAAITTRAGKGTPLSNNEIDDNVLFHDTKGADIASAGTVNLDTATGRWLHITGTTNITAFTLGAGRERTVVFDGILTLTHNASSLICPTGSQHHDGGGRHSAAVRRDRQQRARHRLHAQKWQGFGRDRHRHQYRRRNHDHGGRTDKRRNRQDHTGRC